MESEPMLCGLCKNEVHPLDAHMGRISDKLDTFHIECWNEYYKNEIHGEKDKLNQECRRCWRFINSKCSGQKWIIPCVSFLSKGDK